MNRPYLLVIHFKNVDMIRNEYFQTEQGMKERAKELKKYGNEILHMFKVEEVK